MVAIGVVLGYRYNYYDGFSMMGIFIAVALFKQSSARHIYRGYIFCRALKRGEIFVDIETKSVSKDL